MKKIPYLKVLIWILVAVAAYGAGYLAKKVYDHYHETPLQRQGPYSRTG